MLRLPSLASLLLLVAPITLAAQVVRGRVVDAVTGGGIAGALVELRDTAGSARARTLTNEGGAFSMIVALREPLALRVVAIGYAPVLRAPALPADAADIAMKPHAIALPELRALAQAKGCRAIGDADLYGRLLVAAEGALEVMNATITSGHRTFEVEEVFRTWGSDGRSAMVSRADTTRRRLTEWPIGSIDRDSLREFGFATPMPAAMGNGRLWHGPDLAVLFADWFQQRYCFTVENPGDGARSLVIRYAPLRKSKLVELEGEIRLDPVTLAVTEINYTHVHLPSGVPRGVAGGVVRFASDSSGTWIPVFWSIRAPVEIRNRTINRSVVVVGRGQLPPGTVIVPPGGMAPRSSIRSLPSAVERVGRVVRERGRGGGM